MGLDTFPRDMEEVLAVRGGAGCLWGSGRSLKLQEDYCAEVHVKIPVNLVEVPSGPELLGFIEEVHYAP